MQEKKSKIISTSIDQKTWDVLSKILREERWSSPSEYLRFKIAQDVLRYYKKDPHMNSFLGREDEGVTRMEPSEDQKAPDKFGEDIDLNFLQ